jgi:hypothetical protein
MSKAKLSIILFLVFLTTVVLALPSSMVFQYGYSQTASAASAGGISVLSSCSFRDDIGAYHIVGEITNQEVK